MTIEKNKDGGYLISDIIDGYLVTRRYYGYTKKEALEIFREETK